MLGVARPRARPTPKQLGIEIVVSAVTPQLHDEEQFPAPYSNSAGQGLGQGLLPRRPHTICRSTVNRLWRTPSAEHRTGVFFDGDANELLRDELDCIHSSRVFLLITNAAILVIITGSLAHISLVCLDLFVTLAELPNILLTANGALFSRPLLFSSSNCTSASCSVIPWLWLWLWLWLISGDFPFKSTVVTSLALRLVGPTWFDDVLRS